MKKSVLIVLAAVLSTMTFTQCLSADTVQIPVNMDIVAISSINVAPGTHINLDQSIGLDYWGVTTAPITINCNVPVTVYAETLGVAPLVSSEWQTALQGQGWSTAGNPSGTSEIDIDPILSPFPLNVSVKANNVNMAGRNQGIDQVATTTVTVLPRP